MKKILSLLFVFILTFSLVSCGNANKSQEETNSTQATEETNSTQASGETDSAQATGETDSAQVSGETDSAQATGKTNSTQASRETDSAQATGKTNSAQASRETDSAQAAEGASSTQATESSSQTNTQDVQSVKNNPSSEIKIKVTVGERVLTATLIDNATTRSLISKFPLNVPMMNLYSREMCYRFADSLPANEQQESGYEVGDLSYWSPRHSLVIFYSQNGEVIGNLQKIGHFDSDVEFFKDIPGDVNVKFELLDK